MKIPEYSVLKLYESNVTYLTRVYKLNQISMVLRSCIIQFLRTKKLTCAMHTASQTTMQPLVTQKSDLIHRCIIIMKWHLFCVIFFVSNFHIVIRFIVKSWRMIFICILPYSIYSILYFKIIIVIKFQI